jgi:hypothetical protein
LSLNLLIFTICQNNTLANACVLGDSLKKLHPNYELQIGLVDDSKNIPTNLQIPYTFINVKDLPNFGFEDMAKKYTRNELTANCKPFFAQYFIQKSIKIIYLDCTSIMYNSISFLSEILDNQEIVLVPQLLHAGVHPDEKQILNTGIYHSGVFGIKQSEGVNNFLSWWGNNTKNKGFIDLCKGLNADQLWLEHVPALIDNVHILKSEGLNIGYWNLPERDIYTNNKIDENKLISVNFKGIKYWKHFEKLLDNHSFKKLKNIVPSYGKENPKDKTLQKNIAKNIRSINNIFDWIIDKIS